MNNNSELPFYGNDPTHEMYVMYVSEPTLLIQSSWPDLNQLMQAYCSCEGELKRYIYEQQCNSSESMNQNGTQEEIKESIEISIPTRSRRAPRVSPEHRAAFLRSRYAILHRQLEAVDDPARTIVRGRRKVARSLNRQASTRRSRFTGVFKNHSKWQALIDIFDRKTYIHSYTTEQEAARAYDLMSLVLKGLAGLTNFEYSKTEVLNLIANHSDIIGKFCS